MGLDLTESTAALDGVLIIDKPAGWTSHDVVAKARRLLRVSKIGHTGTLDPAATGVLLLCLGKATRIAEYLVDSDKEYRAVLRLGITTDTQDATGAVTGTAQTAFPDQARIAEVMAGFVGRQSQVPPMYSAVKVKGVPLYKSARAGRTVPRQQREFTIRSLHILSVGSLTGHPPTLDIVFDVACSKGTYVRTLCADIGEALGVGGHLAGLERRRVGRFGIEDAMSLEDLAVLADRDKVTERLHSLAEALADWPAAKIDKTAAEGLRHGVPVPLARVAAWEGTWNGEAHVRLLSAENRLLAIAKTPGGPDELRDAAPGTVLKLEKVLV